MDSGKRLIAVHECGHLAVAGIVGPIFLDTIDGVTLAPPAVHFHRPPWGPAAIAANRPWLLARATRAVAGVVAEARARHRRIDPRRTAGVWATIESTPGSDIGQAVASAAAAAGPSYPLVRALATAFKWADGLVALGEVWSAIEAGSAELAERGELGAADVRRLFGHLEDTLDGLPNAGTWRRRIPDQLLFVPDCPDAAGFTGRPLDWWAGRVPLEIHSHAPDAAPET